ncbi:unnamed protein product [Acanthoscelides obtectus]|uniref:Peptidyl-prolyl cis-trans isomerase n=1 Tax=Acanthoscelides obtectus TaxID=200917 RepID=A0A9P0KCV9_ACAOB|nr:unnamed protein product [Acanthoscelides obtectus]CAK1640897.1 Peptidyl-prolyl cis-trans isomerase sig-7 [Acanthoscelides obtectus]
MSVVIETTLGDLTVDLFLDERPRACLNFLKLCKIKYYNYNLFHTISRGFIAQTGDPTGSRTGGESVFGVIEGPDKRYFEGENKPRIKHTKMGLISFVGNEERMVGSQVFVTLGEDLTYLDAKHCVFGEVVEGLDVLDIINEVICDTDDRPYQDVRITHTVVLDDPYPDPKHLQVPSRSPSPSAERLQGGRIAPDEEINEAEGKTTQEIAEIRADREAKARATILEMIGDIPDADIAPPENILFVCKLNPVTTDEDLEIIFNRFGKIKSCEVIRDRKTGDSLQYAFIEFEEKKSCEDAYFKMDNILIDDRRIHVDFSQSVSKVKWLGKGRVAHFDDKGRRVNDGDVSIGKGNYKVKGGRNGQYKNDARMETVRKEKSRSPQERKRNKSPANKDRRRSRSPRDSKKEYRSIRSPRSNHRNSPKSYENYRGRERYIDKYGRSKTSERDFERNRRFEYRDERHSRSRSSSHRSRNVSPRRGRYKENESIQKKARSRSTERVRHNKKDSSKSKNSRPVERGSSKIKRQISPEIENKSKKSIENKKSSCSSVSESEEELQRKRKNEQIDSDSDNYVASKKNHKKNRKKKSICSDSSEAEEEVTKKKKRNRLKSDSDDSIPVNKKKHKKKMESKKKASSRSESQSSVDEGVKRNKKKGTQHNNSDDKISSNKKHKKPTRKSKKNTSTSSDSETSS